MGVSWVEQQSPARQRAIVVVATILSTWWPKESFGVVQAAFKKLRLSDKDVKQGVLDYLCMVDEGLMDDESFPQSVRNLLRGEDGMVIAGIRAYLVACGWTVDILSNLAGPPSIHTLDRVMDAYAWARIMTVKELLQITEYSQCYGHDLRHHVVDEGTEAYARELLGSRTFAGFQTGAGGFCSGFSTSRSGQGRFPPAPDRSLVLSWRSETSQHLGRKTPLFSRARRTCCSVMPGR